MGEKIVTIVTTVVLLLVFLVLIAFISTDMQISRSTRIVRELNEEIQYRGYITMEQYNRALLRIPLRSARLNLTHIHLDEFSEYEPGVLDMSFNAQIMQRMLANQGVYDLFKVGDQIQIDLVITERTFFDVFIGMVAGRSASGIKILSSESGVILNVRL
jgi:hypothetical protein